MTTATAPSTVAAAMQHAIDLLRDLNPEQLEALAMGQARLEFRSDAEPMTSAAADPAPTPTSPPAPRRRAPRMARTPVSGDVRAAVQAIRGLTTPTEVADYLREHDHRFTAPVLKEIARELGPTVSCAARSKADLRRNIVEGTAGFRQRSAAMSGGAWS